MKTCYVVMREFFSPVAFCIPSPVVVFDTRKEATEFANKKNEKSTRFSYYVRGAKRGEKGEAQ